MIKFYDTCALLNKMHRAFEEVFVISNITIAELENIKNAQNKDDDIKFKARRILELLDTNENKYNIFQYLKDWDKAIETHSFIPLNNDARILMSAYQYSMEKEPVIFVSDDLNCRQIAKTFYKLNTEKSDYEDSSYTGYKEVKITDDQILANFYDSIYKNNNMYNLLKNEYIIIKDKDNKIIDKYKYTEYGFNKVIFHTLKSRQLGEIKPKDEYQNIAIDSLYTNKITMLRGSAGTGKSYLALGYLFEKIEKHEIDKIIIFCNTVATCGAAKLGYYPGDRTTKLLDSQIGNFLASKLGARCEVERLVSEGIIELLPMSDIRGYDTTGMRAGIYITEAQNLDIELMRLALQRVGEDCICIVEGDDFAQVDSPLYAGSKNGMKRLSQVFKNHSVYGEVLLKNVHRSKIAQLANNM